MARPVRPLPRSAVGIALSSPNAVQLNDHCGAGEGDEIARNDAAMGAPSAPTFAVQSVQRDWYVRDRVLFGRSYNDSRVTTRIREWSATAGQLEATR